MRLKFGRRFHRVVKFLQIGSDFRNYLTDQLQILGEYSQIYVWYQIYLR